MKAQSALIKYKMRRDISVALRDDKKVWIVLRERQRYSLIWHDCGGENSITLLQYCERKPLIDIAKQLEAIPGGIIWSAALADGEFESLTSAQSWVKRALETQWWVALYQECNE